MLLVSNLGNVWRTPWRLCILKLECKGLKSVVSFLISLQPFQEFTLLCWHIPFLSELFTPPLSERPLTFISTEWQNPSVPPERELVSNEFPFNSAHVHLVKFRLKDVAKAHWSGNALLSAAIDSAWYHVTRPKLLPPLCFEYGSKLFPMNRALWFLCAWVHFGWAARVDLFFENTPM